MGSGTISNIKGVEYQRAGKLEVLNEKMLAAAYGKMPVLTVSDDSSTVDPVPKLFRLGHRQGLIRHTGSKWMKRKGWPRMRFVMARMAAGAGGHRRGQIRRRDRGLAKGLGKG